MKYSIAKLCLLLIFLSSGTFSLCAQNTAFTYQGRLTAGGGPANGEHDFEFTLFGAPSGGNPLSAPQTLSGVGLSNGVFTVALDFGANVFNGSERWLAIAVGPTGSGTLTLLNPRQPLTPTPYAVTALTAFNVPGVDGHSLHAADGSPTNAVFVDNAGRVGVGTITPASRLHVVSLGNDNAPPRLESVGTDRFGAGWDFYLNGIGKGYVGVPDVNAAFAPGEMLIFGGRNTRTSLWGGEVRALTTDTAGNVEVSGNVRIGPRRLKATGGEENLRIVRGVVSGAGNIITGSGFTVLHHGNGDYEIVFDIPFAELPTVTATGHRGAFSLNAANMDGVTETSAQVVMGSGDAAFHFIAIGPR